MSTHIAAAPGQIAPLVLMPGDPLRAEWIAQTFLTDAVCHNRTRGMLGFTGTVDGVPVSVQGSGMGQPSMAIYAHELFAEYDVQAIVRVGSCGAMAPDLRLRDVVLASVAHTDAAANRHTFGGIDFAAGADFDLLRAAHDAAPRHLDGARAVVGPIFTSDAFYPTRPEPAERLAEHGTLAVEMEANVLYTLAARFSRRALAVCTVSDHLVTGEETTAAEREQTFAAMVGIGLDALRAVATPADA